MDYSGFHISVEDNARIDKWLAEHAKVCKVVGGYHGAIGGAFTYSFTPTSLGNVTVFKCACGEKFNFTHFEDW